MTDQFFLGYYVTYCGLKKRANAGIPVTALFDPQSGKRREELIRFEGLAEYPQLSAGLEIGAVYSWGEAFYFDVNCAENGYLSFLAKLAEMVGHDQEMATPNTPPPFFELLRYGLQAVPFGSKVARKLQNDFNEWDERARCYADDAFYDQYRNAEAFISMGTQGALCFVGEVECLPYEFRSSWKGAGQDLLFFDTETECLPQQVPDSWKETGPTDWADDHLI
ncbi:hypothetical protein [Caballeronia sp. RCC_10]|uniref:hypothetical protein n=1 Tax=Caballeronia sp. RCC_10 TaxID=3239227 RepID=UPI003524C1AD